MVELGNITINNLQQLAQYTNNSVDGALFTGGIITFYIIILILLYKNMEQNGYEFSAVFTTTSWITFIISTFFWFAQLIPTTIPLIFLFLSAFGTIYLYASK